MSSLHTTAVVERLHALDAQGYQTARQVHEYVTSDRERPRPSTEAFLTVLRLDAGLALEVRDSMGRDVVAALTDSNGDVRYPVHTHDALAAKTGVGAVRDTRVERYRGAADIVADRRPRVVLRDGTELAEIEAPDSWDVIDGPGQLEAEP